LCWLAEEARISLSNLIKKEERARFSIGSYEAQEMGKHAVEGARAGASGRVVLPIGRGPDPTSSKAARTEEPGSAENQDIYAEIAQREREAYEKGFEQGQKDGLVLGKRRMEETRRQMGDLLIELGGLKRKAYREAEEEVLQLSVEIARKIMREEIKTDPTLISRTVRAAIGFLVNKSRVRILVSSEDSRQIQDVLSQFSDAGQIEGFEIVEDGSVAKGGCILETGFGRVNATLEDQLAELRNELEQEFLARSKENDASFA
jgi:flagellar assembly protein FliH